MIRNVRYCLMVIVGLRSSVFFQRACYGPSSGLSQSPDLLLGGEFLLLWLKVWGIAERERERYIYIYSIYGIYIVERLGHFRVRGSEALPRQYL